MNRIKIKTLLKFFIPFVISGIVTLTLILADPIELKYAKRYGLLMVAYFIPWNPLGRSTIIINALQGGDMFDMVLSIISIVFVDAVTSLFIVWNFEIATKIPYLGKVLINIEKKGDKMLKKYKWVNRFSIVGLIIFVAIPFLGTNAVVGSIIGKIIGVNITKTWFAVLIGSVLGAIAIAIPVYLGIRFILL